MSYFITEVNNSLQLSKFDDQSENNNSITLYTPLPTKVSYTPGTPGILSVNNGQFYFQNIDKYLYTTVLTYDDIGPIIDGLRYGFMAENVNYTPKLVLVGIGSHTEYMMKYRVSSYNSSLNCSELITYGNILPNVNYLYHIYVLYSGLISDTMVSITVLDSNNKVLTSVQQKIYKNISIMFPNLYIIAKNAHIFRLEMDPMPTNRYMYIAGIPLC